MKNNNKSKSVETESKQQSKIISVEKDFNGNLEDAIASADDGDVVKLGAEVYRTNGISIDKDITIDGRRGTVIDGRGTSNAIFTLDSAASGTTIRDLEITNAGTGIFGDGATDLTLRNLEIHDIGNDEIVRGGEENTAIALTHADGFEIYNSDIYNVSKKGVGINDTDGGIVSGLSIQDINLEAEHGQSLNAGGIKLFNTNEVTVSNNDLSNINAFYIWNDLTNSTIIEDNYITGVGEDFLAPEFNNMVTVSGIYNEKSFESIVRGNFGEAVGDFLAFDATEFSTETMILEDNDFSSMEINSTDFWANEELETIVAITEDPKEAGFELFADSFFEREDSVLNVFDAE